MGEDGYIYVLARDDDVINVAGHRWENKEIGTNSKFVLKEQTKTSRTH